MNRARPRDHSPIHAMIDDLRGLLIHFYLNVDNPHLKPDTRGTGANDGTLYYTVPHLRHVCVGTLRLCHIGSLEELLCLDRARIMRLFRFEDGWMASRVHDAARLLLVRRNVRWVQRSNREQKMAMAKTETGYIGVYREGEYFATGAFVKKKWVPLGIHRTVKMAAFVREFYVHRHNLYGTALNWSNKNWDRVMRMKPMKIKKRKRRRGGSGM